MPYLKREAPSPEPIDCRILTSALDLFVNNGYHNVSIHEVQKQADVSIGSIYKHFGGKEGIARALYQHIMKEMETLVDDVVNEIESPSEQCREIIRQLLGHTETHRNIMAFVFHAKHPEFLPDEPLICNASPFRKLREIILEGMRRGEFQEIDTWVAVSTLFGGPIRMIQLRLDGMIERPLPEYFDDIVAAAWNGLSSQQAQDPKLKVVASGAG